MRMLRRCLPPVVLSPAMRIKMLQSMCVDSRMSVCDKEIGSIEARTMPTLMELQEENPDAEIYFLLGADKLDLLTHLSGLRGFLDMFKVVLYARDKAGITDMLKEDDVLSHYLHRIVLLPQPEGTDTISSSKVRERMLAGEPCADMLCPGVWELFKEVSPADFPETIDSFKGEYDFLSNRFACRFVWQGLKYSNAEAAFQSSRCANERERKALCD